MRYSWLVLVFGGLAFAACGDSGSAGSNGATGATGPMGARGATGPAGENGLAGTPGAPGATGAMGPTGAAGAVGATGPAGGSGSGGIITAYTSSRDYPAIVYPGDTPSVCSNYAGLTLSITVPDPGTGTLYVDASVVADFHHTLGQEDEMVMLIGTADDDCAGFTDNGSLVYWTINSAVPTDTTGTKNLNTFNVWNEYTLTGPGTYMVYVNAYLKVATTDLAYFYDGEIQATYYP